ncbi:hypothetical protein PRUPE_4G168300 [Prunus persica]|uniref:Uncharacterized protein n=1 Tax=Prunus persica TaxID=3760 RepID=A0A251PLR6_PRUPE|nr:uncharacterized protein At2g29880 [Prunus persica]ONI12497.1 hypothetical protein PRUPE_4G168300 [Prunus persica]
MEESQRGNDKGKSKVSGGYKLWTLEESNELLQLMVDAANRGWRDSNGMLSKQTVEKKILPALNAKLGCERNHSQYLSRLKWFKQRYNIFSELMRHSSGFGWDPITKKFTASDEVWKDYIKSHPAHVNFQTDTFADYELLRIAIGNGTAIGRNSIALGDDTDARTLGVEESRRLGIDDLSYDDDNHAFIPNEVEAATFQDLSPKQPNSYVPTQGTNVELPLESNGQTKRNRTEYEGNTSSFETNTRADVLERVSLSIDSIATDFRGIHSLMEKKEKESGCWDAIMEIPNLDSQVRYKVVELLNTKAKKDMFWKMSPQERKDWIMYKLSE